MSEVEHPIQSTSALVKALLFALAIATILFLTMVLPAEYGIDPTGIGTQLGLNNLTNAEPAPVVVSRAGEGDLAFREDTTEIFVPARDGLEYKFFLNQYANLNYEWSSTGSLYFDLHGEPEGDNTGYFESYAAAKLSEMKGSITTPFSGSHGWYFRNDTETDATVTLKTLGNYEIIGLK